MQIVIALVVFIFVTFPLLAIIAELLDRLWVGMLRKIPTKSRS